MGERVNRRNCERAKWRKGVFPEMGFRQEVIVSHKMRASGLGKLTGELMGYENVNRSWVENQTQWYRFPILQT